MLRRSKQVSDEEDSDDEAALEVENEQAYDELVEMYGQEIADSRFRPKRSLKKKRQRLSSLGPCRPPISPNQPASQSQERSILTFF